MKGIWKKIITMCLCAALLVPIAGCKSDGKTEITIGMWPQSSDTNDIAMFERWRQEYNMEFPEVKIIDEPYEYDPVTFTNMAEGGTAPTIFQSWFTEPQKLISQGYVKDITFYYEEKGWLDGYLNPIVKDILSDKNGKIYGVPRDGYALGLYMNMPYMELAGLVEERDVEGVAGKVKLAKYPVSLYNPSNPNDLTTLTGAAIKVQAALDAEYGTGSGKKSALMILSDNKNGGWQFSNIVWNFGGSLQVLDPVSGKYKANLNSPEAVAALEWIKDLKHKYKVLPNGTNLTYNNFAQDFGSGNVAMAFAGNDSVETPIKSFGMKKDDISIAPFPAGPGGAQHALYGGTPFMISSSATDEEARYALEFLHYMGRLPIDDDITRAAYRSGHNTANLKGMPILPVMPVWENEDNYTVPYKQELNKFIDKKEYARFAPFFDKSKEIIRPEETYYPQEMYRILDSCIQKVLSGNTVNCQAELDAANRTFQNEWMSKI